MKKTILTFIILNGLFISGVYSQNKNIKLQQRQLLLENPSNISVDRTLQSRPAQYYLNRANYLVLQNQWNIALLDYNKAIKINPNLAEAYNNRGLLYYKQKRWELALADYNKSTQINPNPNLAFTYSNRGFVYYHQKKWKLALADYNKSTQINPNLAETYILRSLVWLELKNKSRSIEDLKIAAQLFQRQNNISGYQGVTYMLKKLEG